MRDVCEVGGDWPGAEAVWEAPFGMGEPVRLVDNPLLGSPVVFVEGDQAAAASPVYIAEGGPRMAQRMPPSAPSAVSRPPAEPPPDPALLSNDQRSLQGNLNEVWGRVGASGGRDQAVLQECVSTALIGLAMDWPDVRWVENLLMMGGNSAVALWDNHREDTITPGALEVFTSVVTDLDWRNGGPSGMFEAHEAAAMFRALENIQHASNEAGLSGSAQGEGAAAEAQWAPDPYGRHEHRWWDGSRWTEHVATGGEQSLDPPE